MDLFNSALILSVSFSYKVTEVYMYVKFHKDRFKIVLMRRERILFGGEGGDGRDQENVRALVYT